jgi:integrase
MTHRCGVVHRSLASCDKTLDIEGPHRRLPPCLSAARSSPGASCYQCIGIGRQTTEPRRAPSGGTTAWFTTEVGTPLEPRNVLRRFEALAERAGLRGVHLHTLRHSAASFLLAAGTHTKVVQEHLGHSSYAITADIHSHVGPAQQQREAADRLDAALRW